MAAAMRQMLFAIAALAILISMVDLACASPTASRSTSAVDLYNIRVVDHSHGNFPDVDDEFRGVSMTCEVAEIADLFSPAWLKDEAGVSKDVRGDGAACPFKFSIDFLGFDFAKFQVRALCLCVYGRASWSMCCVCLFVFVRVWAYLCIYAYMRRCASECVYVCVWMCCMASTTAYVLCSLCTHFAYRYFPRNVHANTVTHPSLRIVGHTRSTHMHA